MATRLILVLVCVATSADAEDAATPEFKASISREQIGRLMHTDAEGERNSVIPFATMGAATMIGGGLLLATDSKVGQGAAWPLLTIGALEIIGGVIFALRYGPHVRHLDALLASDPAEFARAERKRVYRIRDRYQPILLVTEAVICVAGGSMAAAGAVARRETLTGVGIGLAIQGLALFLIDWAVLDRARAYATALDLFTP
jgi:hypothetical protein